MPISVVMPNPLPPGCATKDPAIILCGDIHQRGLRNKMLDIADGKWVRLSLPGQRERAVWTFHSWSACSSETST